jgi:hypothetical protein
MCGLLDFTALIPCRKTFDPGIAEAESPDVRLWTETDANPYNRLPKKKFFDDACKDFSRGASNDRSPKKHRQSIHEKRIR